MASLIGGGRNNWMVVTSGLKFIPFRLGNEDDKILIKEIPNPIGTKVETKQPDGGPLQILAGAFSPNGSLLALCDDHKQLTLWETSSDWKCINQRNLIRRANKITFSPDSKKMFVADKTGDAYVLSVDSNLDDKVEKKNGDNNDVKEDDSNNFRGELLLGHLSMLLDILVSPDGKYVITADRDEKIRVSNYPDAYDIHGYCLGHTDFVTEINFVLDNKHECLVSSSGDGSIKLWKYMEGIEMDSVIPSSVIEDKPKDLSENAAVKSIKTFSYNQTSTVISVALEGFNGLIVYSIQPHDNSYKFEHVQTISHDSNVWSHQYSSDGTLIVLSSDCSMTAYKINDKTFNYEKQNVSNYRLNKKEELKEFYEIALQSPDNFSTLKKRLLDNVSEYLKRKEERIEKESKSNNQQPEVKKIKL